MCGWWLNSLKDKEIENAGQPFDTRLTMYKQRQGWGTSAGLRGWPSKIDEWRDNVKRNLGMDLNNAMIADVDLLAPAADLMTLAAVFRIFDHSWCETGTNA